MSYVPFHNSYSLQSKIGKLNSKISGFTIFDFGFLIPNHETTSKVILMD